MSKFAPNLPTDDIKTVVMSTINGNVLNGVEALGIEVISTQKNSALLPFENTHADMQILHYSKDEIFVLNECTSLSNQLEPLFKNLYFTKDTIHGKYPANVLLNAVMLNEFIICKENSLDKSLQDKIKNDGKIIINTRQGYTKCSTCIVSDNALITSDKSIYKAACSIFDVLLIKSGYIDLPGTDYGFIGGCSFKINKSILAFTGNIKSHPDYQNIKAFCRNHGVYLKSITSNNLLDVGSIIPVD